MADKSSSVHTVKLPGDHWLTSERNFKHGYMLGNASALN